jgi:hypothetical protein
VILAALIAALGRFGSRIVNTALGWASLLLFGRVPRSKQSIVSAMALASLGWVLAVLGVLIPRVSAFLLTAIPIPDIVPTDWIRLAMIGLAVGLPVFVGLGSLFLVTRAARPRGLALVPAVLRGYLIASLLAIVLVFLAGVGSARKIRSLAKRWSDAHIGIVVRAASYDRLVGDIRSAVAAAGFELTVAGAPTVLALPARLVGAIAGPTVGGLAPTHLSQLVSPTLEILVYPSDISLSGSKEAVAGARAAIVRALGGAPVYLTTSTEAQAIEERIKTLADDAVPARTDADARLVLRGIDGDLSRVVVGNEDWDTLYRLRLQVERDLLLGDPPDRAGGADEPAGIGETAADRGTST